jgi:hypothetical protein
VIYKNTGSYIKRTILTGHSQHGVAAQPPPAQDKEGDLHPQQRVADRPSPPQRNKGVVMRYYRTTQRVKCDGFYHILRV